MTPDEHLRAALRHAPDAQLQAPHELGAQIIAAAHRASAEPPVRQAAGPAPNRRSLWAEWFGGRPLRLGTSGALASVLLAGVIALMWQAAPPGAAVDERVSLNASAPPPPVPASAPAPAPEMAPVPAQTERAQPRTPAATQPKPLTVPTDTPAPRPMAPPATAPTTAATATLPLALPSPVPSPLPSAVVAAESADAVQSAPRPAAARTAGAAMAPAPATAMAIVAAPAPAPARANALALAAPPPPWSALLADSALPSWRLNGQALAVDRPWLQALAQQTQGRWSAAPGATPADSDLQLLWLQGDVPGARLWLGPTQAIWCSAQGICQSAPLPEGVAARLMTELEEAPPLRRASSGGVVWVLQAPVTGSGGPPSGAVGSRLQ